MQDKALPDAVKGGEAAEVERLLEDGADVSAVDSMLQPLHICEWTALLLVLFGLVFHLLKTVQAQKGGR